MGQPALHRFTHSGRHYALDPETCFCFECDAISWDVIEYYPRETTNRIVHLLRERYERKELLEVINELEWLRATKAILKSPQKEELLKRYEIERGLRQMTVSIPGGPAARALIRDCCSLFLARSAAKAPLEFSIQAGLDKLDAAALAHYVDEAMRMAALADRNMTISVVVGPLTSSRPSPALAGHAHSVHIAFQESGKVREALEALARTDLERLDRIAKLFAGLDGRAAGRLTLHPGNTAFKKVLEECDPQEFGHVVLDMDGAFAEHPDWEPAEVFAALRETAVYYANRLLKGHYFRLDPIAGLFRRIYLGEPIWRADPAGAHELAVDANGFVYPSRLWLGQPGHRCGAIGEGRLDEARLRQFDDSGALTTPACVQCWARCLCGGGAAAVHHSLTGDHRTPSGTWCDAQRAWLEAAVAAFNILSAQGINFSRVYQSLGRAAKPSLFQLVRAAFRTNIGLRPIEESDAEWLTKWENWNEAAYFLATESGTFMATRHDREMDSLYPREYEQEFVLLRKSGDPLGLLRIRSDRLPGVARAWVYMRNDADYADSGIRRSFRSLIDEAGAQKELRRLLVPVGPKEDALAAFLSSVGFTLEGAEREGLYLHARYHDLRIYGLTLSR